MKKINFKNLSNDEILTRDELKKIIGGDGSGWDADYPNLVSSSRDDCPDKACSSNLDYGLRISCISRVS